MNHSKPSSLNIPSVAVIILASITLIQCSAQKPKEIVSSPPVPVAKTPSPPPADVKAAEKYRRLGIQYRNQNSYSEAIKALSQAVKLDPQNLSGQVVLGWTQHLAGNEKAAAQTLQKTLTQVPNHVPALNALGIVYLVSGDLQAAVATHTKAAALDPDNEVAYYNLNLAYHRLKQYDQAIAQGKKAARLEPNNPHPWVALAITYWDQGEKAIAQQTYTKAISLDARYRERQFLIKLKEAGFSPEQIQVAQTILTQR